MYFSNFLYPHSILKSKKILQVTKPTAENNPKLETYRLGFSVVSRDGGVIYFNDIEEAITEIIARSFFREVLLNSVLFKEEKRGVFDKFYSAEISSLNKLVDDLWEENKRSYPNRDDILKLFISVKLNGRPLQLARLLEKTFGSGFFRFLGEESKKEFKKI